MIIIRTNSIEISENNVFTYYINLFSDINRRDMVTELIFEDKFALT